MKKEGALDTKRKSRIQARDSEKASSKKFRIHTGYVYMFTHILNVKQ